MTFAQAELRRITRVRVRVTTGELDCGHFLPEERPAETATALLAMLT